MDTQLPITITFSEDCTQEESNLLNYYWKTYDQVSGKFPPIKEYFLNNSTSINPNLVNHIATKKSEVYWIFKDCECGRKHIERINNRTQLGTFLNYFYEGIIDKIFPH